MRIPSHFLVELCSMARSLSTILFKGVGTFRTSSSLQPTVASGSLLSRHGLRYSTISDDSDTHEDFKPANKLEGSSLSVQDVVEKDVKENPIIIYMKGLPDAPRCGFSALAVRVLKEYGVPVSARNILEDPELKSSVKAFSNWPTFPQIFINGEFVGGSDIILNMHQTGELKQKLEGFGAGSNP